MTRTFALIAAAVLVCGACTVHKTEEPPLVGPSTFVVAPPADAPTPRFEFSPEKPIVGQSVLFDGTKSCAGPEFDENNCRPTSSTISRFVWDFGDGSTGTGPTATHRYVTARFYAVTLTVTNDRGLSTPTTKAVDMAESAPPSASFDFLPADPEPGTTVRFAETSKPVAGRKNVLFEWDFGDPGSPENLAVGNTVSHRYTEARPFVVTLIITDDLGQRSVAIQTVPVKTKTTGTGLTSGATFSRRP